MIGERIAELRERDLRAHDLGDASEVLAINAVRGARPIVELDGRALGHADGPGLARLNEVLDAEAP